MNRQELAGLLVVAALIVGFGALAAAVDSGYRDGVAGPSTPESTMTPLNESAVDTPEPDPIEHAGSSGFDTVIGLLATLVTFFGAVSSGLGLVTFLGGAVLVLGGVVMLVGGVPGRASDQQASAVDEEEAEADGADDEEESTLDDLGQAAGDAADRIERGGAFENEVYRAYQEMTDMLALSNPEARAPTEFEQRAVEAGMTPEDAGELVTLFAEVRYGGRDPEAREERAVAALRRVEEAYAGETER